MSLRYLVRRLIVAVALLWVLTVATFAVYFAIPADPAGFVLDMQRATPAQIAKVHRELGTDKPVYVQYEKFLVRALHGDLGTSWNGITFAFAGGENGTPVGSTVLRAAGVTGSLVLGGAVLLLLVAVPLGALAASRPGSILDRAAIAFSLVGVCTHPLVVALVLQLFVGNTWHLAPPGGYCSFFPQHFLVPGTTRTVSAGANSVCWASHLILPWITFALFFVALYMRMIRARLLEVLQEPFVSTARAKGASEARIIRRHALPNALLPVITMIGMDVGTAIGVAVYIETVYGLPGLGFTTLRALAGIRGYDLPMILGVVLVVGAAIITINLLIDLFAAVIDPTVGRGQARSASATGGLR